MSTGPMKPWNSERWGLAKSKKVVRGVAGSEEVDVKMFISLGGKKKIQANSDIGCEHFVTLCSVKMNHWFSYSVVLHPQANPSLQEEPMATDWFALPKGDPRTLLSAWIIFTYLWWSWWRSTTYQGDLQLFFNVTTDLLHWRQKEWAKTHIWLNLIDKSLHKITDLQSSWKTCKHCP